MYFKAKTRIVVDTSHLAGKAPEDYSNAPLKVNCREN